MAFKQFAMFALVGVASVMFFPCLARATEWTVGDGHGWTIHEIDYTEWAKDKVFKVGDKLVFNYNAELHNVLTVNQHEYQTCTFPPMNPALPVTGKDVITLTTPGKKWFICGRFTHCVDYKQKLAIDVVGEWSLATAPAPSNSNMMVITALNMFGVMGATWATIFLL